MLTKSEEHEKRLYKSNYTRQLNRYTDILTFKDTRVVLKVSDTDYIIPKEDNASQIYMCENVCVCVKQILIYMLCVVLEKMVASCSDG